MTLDELIQNYQKRLGKTNSKKSELKKIIKEIDRLTDTEHQKPISTEQKIRILKELRQEILSESSVEHYAQDNSEFLKLLDLTIKNLGEK